MAGESKTSNLEDTLVYQTAGGGLLPFVLSKPSEVTKLEGSFQRWKCEKSTIGIYQ